MWSLLASGILVIMFGTSIAQQPFCPVCVCPKCEYEETGMERALSNVLALKDTLDNITETHAKVEENLKIVHEERVKLQDAMTSMEEKKREIETRMKTLVDQTTSELTAMMLRVDKNIVPVVLFDARHTWGNISYNVNDLILYSEVVANEGGGYDKNTGIFTASVPGVYMFTVHSCNSINEWAALEIVHDGRPLQRSNIWDKEHGICASMQAFAKVAIGEQIWVRSTWSPIKVFSDEKYYVNAFSGLLIHI